MGAPIKDIVQLQAVPHQPHIVVGCSSSGALAVWDTWTRQLLAGLQPPGPEAVAAVAPVDLVAEHARRRAHQRQQAAAAAAAEEDRRQQAAAAEEERRQAEEQGVQVG